MTFRSSDLDTWNNEEIVDRARRLRASSPVRYVMDRFARVVIRDGKTVQTLSRAAASIIASGLETPSPEKNV